MEDPIRFDVYGRVFSEQREDAVKTLLYESVYATELSARKAIVASKNRDGLMLLASSLSWSNANIFYRQTGCAAEISIYQEGWSPQDDTQYCERHKYYFGGCLGCHVCSGFYVE